VSGAASAAPARPPARGRWLPLLLVPLSLLPDLGAALPLRSYFFRDFTVTFAPLRLFAAWELREGRVAFWNPYLFEGSFQLPVLYPPDWLHALCPTPTFVSWILTLHLPLAALGAYWLARELEASRTAAFVSGVAFALCGLTLSSLNLYVFLQALALAPFVAGLLGRAAVRGGRSVVGAALVLAVATTTLAVEFVAQAVLLGIALGAARAGRRAPGRLALALALAAGLAAVPIATVLGLLPETARGAGFGPDVALANSVHPAVLLQAVLPHLFGDPAAPAEAWWGGRFFSKGLPYFVSLYLGPVVLSLAMLGMADLRPRLRIALLVPAGFGLWYALGPDGGLAPLLRHLPLAAAFRFPSKALLLPCLVTTLLAGLGVDRLREAPTRFRRLAALAAAWAAMALTIAVLLDVAPGGLVAWTGVAPGFWPSVVRIVWVDALVAAIGAGVVTLLALGVLSGRLPCGTAIALLAALVIGDLARAGAGLNEQVAPSYFDLRPGTKALLQGGGRVFSYGSLQSPAFRKFLASATRGKTVAGVYLNRQVLGPYTNILDRLESPEATDLTSFAPRPPELDATLYDPLHAGELVPWLRNAAVSRVVSLDPLDAAGLVELGVVPTGIVETAVHVYAVEARPRSRVACHVVDEADVERAQRRVYAADFDWRRDVVISGAPQAGCSTGAVLREWRVAGHESFDVSADGRAYLVVRGSYARGWEAEVDGAQTPVWRADGKHRAVAFPPGTHHVSMRYQPPGLRAGLWATALATVLAVGLVLRGRPGA
jgi:hypothetical protein